MFNQGMAMNEQGNDIEIIDRKIYDTVNQDRNLSWQLAVMSLWL